MSASGDLRTVVGKCRLGPSRPAANFSCAYKQCQWLYADLVIFCARPHAQGIFGGTKVRRFNHGKVGDVESFWAERGPNGLSIIFLIQMAFWLP
jgi:hypothetical protein